MFKPQLQSFINLYLLTSNKILNEALSLINVWLVFLKILFLDAFFGISL